MDENEIITNWPQWVTEKMGDSPHKAFKFGKISWCHAFYRGDQYKIWDDKTGVVRDVNVNRETRCVYNICRPFADAYTAKMLKGDPIPQARPYSTNTEEFDEDLSMAFNGLSEFWFKTVVNGSERLRNETQWASVGGIGIAKVYWNKNKGMLGDVDWEDVNPLHFFPNPDARTESEFRWVIHRFPKEKSVAEEEFADEMRQQGISSLIAEDKSVSEEERAFASKSTDTYYQSEEKNTVIYNDVWIKRCKKYPNGKHVVVVGQYTMIDDDNSEPDMLPFFTYIVQPTLDDPYGQGVIFPILTIQRDMNRLCSIIMENSSQMGLINWLVSENANMLDTQFRNTAGNIMRYAGTYKPEQSQAVPMPQHIVGRFWELFRIAQFITRLQDVGMGMIPYRGSQTSPGVVQELKNSEDVLFAPDVARMTDFVRRIMTRFRYLTKKYYQEERVVQILGENKRLEAMSYLAKNDDNNYDFDIKVGEGFGLSDKAVVDQIMTLMQNGAFEKSGVDMRLVTEEVLKRVGLNKIREDTFIDERQAKRFLNIILQGGQVTFSKYSNLGAHMKVFTNFVKQPQYEVLDPKIKLGIDTYLDNMVMAQQQQQMQMMMPSGGPGQQSPQMPTPTQQQEAAANRQLGQGQPVENNEAASEIAPQGEING